MKAKMEQFKSCVSLTKVIFKLILGFNSCWDYELINIFTWKEVVGFLNFNEVSLKCDSVEGSTVKRKN